MGKVDKRVFLALHLLLFLFACTAVLSKLAAQEEFLSLRFFLFFGGEFLLLGIYAVGWSSMMALQLVLGGIILLVLGLAGEYIGRIYMCINASPQYVERQVIRKRG